MVHHGPSPSPVLAHRKDLGQLVVTLREGREQLLREEVPVTGDSVSMRSSRSEMMSL